MKGRNNLINLKNTKYLKPAKSHEINKKNDKAVKSIHKIKHLNTNRKRKLTITTNKVIVHTKNVEVNIKIPSKEDNN